MAAPVIHDASKGERNARRAFSNVDGRLQACASGWAKPFLRSAGVLLFLTGCAKLVSVWPPYETVVREPLTQLPWPAVMAMAGVWEVALAITAWRSVHIRRSLALLGFTAFVFSRYRAALWVMGVDQPCACLGRATAWAQLPPQLVDLTLKAMLLFWLGGSSVFLILNSEEPGRSP